MAKQKIKVTVPESMHEVKLGTFIEYMKAVKGKEEDEKYCTEQALKIFCGIDTKLIKKMQRKQIEEISKILAGILSKTYGLVPTFEHEGIKYGFHPNLDDMKVGEFTDLETYAQDITEAHKFTAVLYRPITDNRGDRYRIEKYAGTSALSPIMMEQPASYFLGARGFFLRLGIALTSSTLSSMSKEKALSKLKETSVKSGDGTACSIH